MAGARQGLFRAGGGGQRWRRVPQNPKRHHPLVCAPARSYPTLSAASLYPTRPQSAREGPAGSPDRALEASWLMGAREGGPSGWPPPALPPDALSCLFAIARVNRLSLARANHLTRAARSHTRLAKLAKLEARMARPAVLAFLLGLLLCIGEACSRDRAVHRACKRPMPREDRLAGETRAVPPQCPPAATANCSLPTDPLAPPVCLSAAGMAGAQNTTAPPATGPADPAVPPPTDSAVPPPADPAPPADVTPPVVQPSPVPQPEPTLQRVPSPQPEAPQPAEPKPAEVPKPAAAPKPAEQPNKPEEPKPEEPAAPSGPECVIDTATAGDDGCAQLVCRGSELSCKACKPKFGINEGAW